MPEAVCHAFQNATLIPFQNQTYGVFDHTNKLIPEALLHRSYGTVFAPAPYVEPAFTEENGIFGGFLFKHYGHFLLEGLARLWFAAKHPTLPVFWVARNADILSFQEEVFSLLGLKNTMRFVDHPVRLRHLFLPEPGFIIKGFFYPFHNTFLSKITPSPTIPGKKIYLSRRHFGGESGLLNEDALERILQHENFLIYYPEEHSIADQLSMLSSAEKILAVEGSALHTLLFLTHCEAQILLIPRPKTQGHPNFSAIAALKGFRQSYLPKDELYSRVESVSGTHIEARGELRIDTLLDFIRRPSWDPYALFGRNCTTSALRSLLLAAKNSS